MGYYQGDHYRGDYYRGDPGFLSFIGNAFKGVAGIVGGLARTALTSIVPGIGVALQARAALQSRGVNLPAPYVPGPVGMIPGIGGMVDLAANRLGGGGGVGIMAPGGGIITRSPMGTPVSQAGIMMQLARQRHTHPNKSTYITRGGGTSRWPVGLAVHPKGTELVTSRRMNVGNARALRRALRRARGFAKLAHRVLRATHQFKGKGFGGRRKSRR